MTEEVRKSAVKEIMALKNFSTKKLAEITVKYNLAVDSVFMAYQQTH